MVETISPTAAQPQGRRERNKMRVKNGIYEAALELFTQQGYDQTTVEEIAERADVARGTFFNHFQRKEDIIGEWSERRRVLLREGLDPEGIENPEGADIRHTLSRCMSILAQITLVNSAQTKALLSAWVRAGAPLHEEPHTAHLFSRFIEAGRASGGIPESVDSELAGHLLRDVYLGTLFRWARKPAGQGDLEAELQAACTALLDGLAPR
ncbi:TetR family transcriptional regulator [Streptomyces sp. CB09001]|uniref:TetR/AcrR family transcriptional regulator n=1 Tax=unclassified Streptomyces TaxID=2593676 RepID=UPI000E21415F|nr:TetR/AcrR family transcriptional regulator [Streptomyces sp. CB09001]AXL89204.1 TetR family transcriptional regulator [Streptomyces sp. CB09001]